MLLVSPFLVLALFNFCFIGTVRFFIQLSDGLLITIFAALGESSEAGGHVTFLRG
jgi:hypothetical protein